MIKLKAKEANEGHWDEDEIAWCGRVLMPTNIVSYVNLVHGPVGSGSTQQTVYLVKPAGVHEGSSPPLTYSTWASVLADWDVTDD